MASIAAGTLVVPTGLPGTGGGPGGGGGGVDFSADEQDTGQSWTDGAPVYVKTVNLGNLALPHQVKEVAHGIVGLTHVIDVAAVISHAGQWVPVSRSSPGIVNITVTADHVVVESGAASRTDWQGWATITYTRQA